jgi:hypothetical protein
VLDPEGPIREADMQSGWKAATTSSSELISFGLLRLGHKR